MPAGWCRFPTNRQTATKSVFKRSSSLAFKFKLRIWDVNLWGALFFCCYARIRISNKDTLYSNPPLNHKTFDGCKRTICDQKMQHQNHKFQ